MKLLLPLCLLLAPTGCAAPDPVPQPPDPEAVQAMAVQPPQEESYRLGLAAWAHISRSMHASYDFPGYARTDVTFAAVVVDSGGVIRACALDGVSISVPFDATGALQLSDGTVFPSKTALGHDYGMHKASALGTEWYQQAADFAGNCVGKTAAQLRGGDAISSVTISADSLLHAVLRAAETAQLPVDAPVDAPVTPTLVCRGRMEGSRSAAIDSGEGGLACVRVAAAAACDTVRADCAVLSAIPFTAHGRIACDTAQGLSALSDVLRSTAATAEELQALREIPAQT